MEEVLTTEDIARDILRTSYKLLKRYDDSIEKDDKEKYLQYAPQVFKMCADFQNQFQSVSVGKINLAPYPAKNFCEWLQEQAKVQRSRKDS